MTTESGKDGETTTIRGTLKKFDALGNDGVTLEIIDDDGQRRVIEVIVPPKISFRPGDTHALRKPTDVDGLGLFVWFLFRDLADNVAGAKAGLLELLKCHRNKGGQRKAFSSSSSETKS